MVRSSWSSSLRPRSRFEWKLFLTLFSVLVYVKSEQTQTLEKAFQYKTFRLLWNFLHDDRFGASVQPAWNCRIFLKDNMTSMPVRGNRSVPRSNPRSDFSTNKIKNSWAACSPEQPSPLSKCVGCNKMIMFNSRDINYLQPERAGAGDDKDWSVRTGVSWYFS